uniref:Uncharacterized protein n=1 Tax=Myotis myotis TaxID=51298 RepID=A0A7J7WVE5_MYOMY|nr:hypothetical protein mMyoMyo1_011857 [Myotis myotis]
MCLESGFNVAPLSFIILACTQQKKVWKQKTINANGLLPLPSGIIRSGITSNFRLANCNWVRLGFLVRPARFPIEILTVGANSTDRNPSVGCRKEETECSANSSVMTCRAWPSSTACQLRHQRAVGSGRAVGRPPAPALRWGRPRRRLCDGVSGLTSAAFRQPEGSCLL